MITVCQRWRILNPGGTMADQPRNDSPPTNVATANSPTSSPTSASSLRQHHPPLHPMQQTRMPLPADPPQRHGPYYQLTRKIDGKTTTRRLTPSEAELYHDWINNDRRMRHVINQMRYPRRPSGRTPPRPSPSAPTTGLTASSDAPEVASGPVARRRSGRPRSRRLRILSPPVRRWLAPSGRTCWCRDRRWCRCRTPP